jgi:hypothetical protein
MKFHNKNFDFFIPRELDFFLKDCRVLDLASHTGESTICISERGAKSVVGVEPRIELIDQSKVLAKQNNIDNVCFVPGDCTNKDQLLKFLQNVDTVTTFGMFYHIADHNVLIRNICESGAKHLLIETEYGPESPLPSMHWYVENTEENIRGWNGYAEILAGVPNLKWINDCLTIYNWQIIYYKAFYQGHKTQDQRQRMIIGAVNLKDYNSEKIDTLPENLWEWSIQPNCDVAKIFFGFKNEI